MLKFIFQPYAVGISGAINHKIVWKEFPLKKNHPNLVLVCKNKAYSRACASCPVAYYCIQHAHTQTLDFHLLYIWVEISK